MAGFEDHPVVANTGYPFEIDTDIMWGPQRAYGVDPVEVIMTATNDVGDSYPGVLIRQWGAMGRIVQFNHFENYDIGSGDFPLCDENNLQMYVDGAIWAAHKEPAVTEGFAEINIQGVNDAPIATGESYETDEDTPITYPAPELLLNDFDIDTGTVLFVSGVDPEGLSWSPDGGFSFDPTLDFDGLDDTETQVVSYTYTVSDGDLTDTATVTFTVHGRNDAPVAQDDAYTTDENTVLVAAATGLLANDTDVDVEPLTVQSVDDSALLGTLVWEATGKITYNPNGQFEYLDVGETATETFTYVITDGTVTDTATVTITITGVNDAPVAVADSYVTDEDTLVVTPAPGLLGNDTDADLEPLSVGSLDATGLVGALAWDGDGSFSYDPTAVFQGLDDGESSVQTFTYQASDGTALSNSATVTITVNGVNDAPVAVADTYSTDENTVLNTDAPGVSATTATLTSRR